MRKLAGIVITCLIGLLGVGISALSAPSPTDGRVHQYQFDKQLGSHPERQLWRTTNVAVNPQGLVYVADALSGTVTAFDSEGKFATRFGGLGTGPGRFFPPRDMLMQPGLPIAVSSSFVYVADPRLGWVQKFTLDGKYVGTIGATGQGDSREGRIQGANSICLDKNGDLYVVGSSGDSGGAKLSRFDPRGKLVAASEIDDGILTMTPQGVAVVSRDAKSMRVLASSEAEARQMQLPATLLASQEGWFLSGAAADSKGRLYAADVQSGSIVRIDQDGKTSEKLSAPGLGSGNAFTPLGVAVGPDDQAYVVDSASHALYKYDKNGKPKLLAGGNSEDGQFLAPEDVAVDNAGNIWVADTGNKRIQKHSADGTYLSQIKMDGNPMGIASDTVGNLFVATNNPDAIVKIDASGKRVDGFAKAVSASGIPTRPTRIRVYGRELYVCGRYKVQMFSTDGKYIREMNPGRLPQNPNEQRPIAPDSVAVNKNGVVYVADGISNQVMVFNHSGKLLKTLHPSKGGKHDTGDLYPISIAVVDDQLVGLDYASGNLYNLGDGSKVQLVFAGDKVPGGDISRLMDGGIAVSRDGKLLIADTLNHRVIALHRQ